MRNNTRECECALVRKRKREKIREVTRTPTKMRKWSSPPLMAAVLLLAGLLLLVRGDESTERQISDSLERKLNESILWQTVNYTRVNTTALPYNASTYFNPKGMGQLYNVTNMFIDFIQPKQAFPEGMIYLVNGSPRFADPVTEWRIIVTHYGGLAGLALAGVLLAAVLPCVGLFFCCCRCAGHCGARSEPFDKKHDHCRKIFLSFLLIGFATILLFGVVCAFVTNEHMQEGTRDFPFAAQTSLFDFKLYLDTLKRQVVTLLKTNYAELEKVLKTILQESGKIVTDQLAESSHAMSLTHLNDIVDGLESIRKDLKMMNDLTKELRTNAFQLAVSIRRVKKNLLQTLTDCGTQDCNEVMHKYRVNDMAVQADFDKLPDTAVTEVLNNISQLMDDNIVAEVRKGKDQFMIIQKEIQQAVNTAIPVVSDSISLAGNSLNNVSNSVMSVIDGVNRHVDTNIMPQFDSLKRYVNQYSPYRYYLGLGISGILLTVLTCLTFGLLCGICGKRPDGYGDDCCNKGSGARFLMMAVWIIFLLTSILMIITVVHMITGVLTQRAVCEPLKNPNDNRMFKLIDEMLQTKKILQKRNPNADLNMTHIFNSCHRNEPLYTVLKVQHIMDVNTLKGYIDRFEINQTIHKLEQKISLSRDYQIISETARKKLIALADSGLSDIKFYQYTENLKGEITSINLEQLAQKLLELAGRLHGHEDIKGDLLKNAYDLEGYHRDIVIPMTNMSNQLNESAIELQEHIKFNYTSMTEAIHTLIDEVDKAQVFLTKEGPTHVRVLAANLSKAFIYQVKNYLDYVVNETTTNVGKCGPISNSYNATLVAGCNKILDPFNGFWASVGWCLILFIPTIVLCVKLSALYQKSDPYPGPLVEAIHDKKYVAHGRHHHPGGGYPESYDGPAVGYSDRERITDAHQSTSHHDSRYSDLAPNLSPQGPHQAQQALPAKQNNSTKVFSVSLGKPQNWDFPNGGPPRYQPAAVAPPLSTEYERPPPYYYPGPGDRN